MGTRTPWSPALRRRNHRLLAARVVVARQMAARPRPEAAEPAPLRPNPDPHERAGFAPVSLEPPYRLED